MIRAHLIGETLNLSRGTQLRDFLHVDDAARALLLGASAAGDKRGSVWNVGSGAIHTVREAATRIGSMAGGRGTLNWGGRPELPYEIHNGALSTARIGEDLGFQPRFTLDEGLRDTVAWWRGHPQSDVQENKGS